MRRAADSKRQTTPARRRAAPAGKKKPTPDVGSGRRLGAFYATGPAVPLATPGAKKHEAAQPKEKPAAVGRRGDPWEREADSVADKVGRGEATPEVSRMPKGALRSQRKEDGGDDDAQEMGIQRQEDESQQQEEAPETEAQSKEDDAQEADDDTETQEAAEETDTQQADDESESQQQDEAPEADAQSKEDGAQEADDDSETQEAAEETDTQQADDESESQQQDEAPEADAQSKEDGAQEADDDSETQEATEEADTQQADDESESQQQDEAPEADAQSKEDDAQETDDDSETQEATEETDTQQADDESESQQQDEVPEADAQSKEDDAQETGDESEAQEASDDTGAQQQNEDTQEASEDGETQQAAEDSESQETEDDAQESPASGDRRQRKKGRIAARAIRERGAGEPLAASTRSTLETGMGQDLSGVRVHSDGRSRDAARAMRAKAFTHKNNIWLGQGESQSNLKLMAHETTHVMQQGGVERKTPAAGGGSSHRDGSQPGAEPTSVEPGASAITTPGEPATGPAASGGGPAATPASATPPAASPGTPAVTGAGQGVLGSGMGAPATGIGGSSKRAASGASGSTRPSGQSPPSRRGGSAPAAGPVETETEDPTGVGDAAAAAVARQTADRRRMAGVKRNLGRAAKRQQGPAASPAGQRRASTGAAGAASKAAPSPDNEPKSEGEAAHTEVLAGSKAGKVNQKSFLDLVESKLEGMDTPKSLEDMDEFKEKGGAEGLKGEVAGGVTRESNAAASKIKGAATKTPTPTEKRSETPLPKFPKAPGAAPIRAAKAAPLPRAGAEVSLEPSRNKVETDLARNRLTTKRLEKAKDPRFSAVQKSRKDVGENADRAPGKFRRDEASVLAGERGGLKAAERTTGGGMRASHTMAQGMIRGDQGVGMINESLDRTRIASWINGEYTKVETAVRGKLDWLSGKEGEGGEVDRLFDKGEKTAREDFEKHVDSEMSNWRWKRYGGRAAIPIIGGLVAAGTWVYDKLKGIDKYPEIVQIFDDGRALYLSGLRTTIRGIAKVVDDALEFCQSEIKKGRTKIRGFVSKLPKNLTKIGKETAAGVFEKFDTLRDDVEAKKDELADHLAGRYKQSVTKIDQRINEMQAENRGLVDRFVSALKEVVEAIRNFRKKLKPILADASDVIEEILDDPIAFLKNLLRAVKKGFDQFKSRIGMHLKKGLLGWLFGALASTGIQIPKEFSLKSIMGLILQVLGVTYDKLRTKAVRLVGPKAVAVVEKVGGYLTTLFRDGPGGLWKEIKGDLADLKDLVIGQIKSWLITRIIKAAITKLVSMFNPVGAIVQAVLTIYNVVMFFIERINQILELVKTVVQSAIKVVRGQIQAAADKIEQTLGLMVPLIISFLARLLGLGGIADKVRKIIERVRRRVDKAINKFLRKLVKKFKALFGRGGKRRKKGEKAPTNDPKVREARKKKALAKIRAAMRKGIRRKRLRALVSTLKKQLKLKRAVLTSKHDVEIENSSKEAVRGDEVAYELRATKGTTKTAKGKKVRKKTTRGGLKLGRFKATAPSKKTARGVLEDHLSEWPYPDMPKKARRPSSVSVELFGKTDYLGRVTTAKGQRFVGELGNVEARVRRKSADYDGGHIVANQLGGLETFENMVPMRSTFNRSGVYKKFEAWIISKLPKASSTGGATPSVNLSMKISPRYAGDVKTTVAHAADRLRQRLKGFGARKQIAEEKGSTFEPQAGPKIDSRVVSRRGEAATEVVIPTRIPTRFDATVDFTAEVDPADKLGAADREKLDAIPAAKMGRAGAPTEDPLIVLEELTPKGKGGKKTAAGKPGAKPPATRKVKAQKSFKFPHVDLD